MTKEERQKTIDALKISAPLMVTTQEEFNDYIKTLNMIMDWLEQEPCEDAISRQEAIRIAEQGQIQGFEWQFRELVKLPSVTPAEKTGRWISHRERCDMNNLRPSGLGSYFWCSKCDCGIDNMEWHRNNYNYCPNCGRHMVEPQESEDKCKNCEYYRNPDYTRCHECEAESEDKE